MGVVESGDPLFQKVLGGSWGSKGPESQDQGCFSGIALPRPGNFSSFMPTTAPSQVDVPNQQDAQLNPNFRLTTNIF